MQGTLTTLRTTKDYQPYPPMQNPEGVAAAAAAQRQQQDQALAAATQRDTAESLVLLREAVLRLTQQAVRETPTAAPTSRHTKLRPRRGGLPGGVREDGPMGELAGGPVGSHPVPLPKRTRTAGEPGFDAGARQSVPNIETGNTGASTPVLPVFPTRKADPEMARDR
ncbi:unnamed protein product [Arctogadus glacialis]